MYDLAWECWIGLGSWSAEFKDKPDRAQKVFGWWCQEHGVLLWDGAVQGKSWIWWSLWVPSDSAYSLWFIDSVIVTVERKCQAWWNYCSCLATVMKLLTLITFFHAFMEARWSKHMFSYGYLGKGGLIYTSQFGLVYSIHSSPVSTVGKMVWVWQRMHEKRPRTNLINVRRWSRYTL